MSSDQPTAQREWGYSPGWRLFTVTVLRPLLRLLMRHEWQGREYFPRTGGVILAPNHMSYADWPTVALFSDAYGHRYPVFMIKSAVFEVKVLGHIADRDLLDRVLTGWQDAMLQPDGLTWLKAKLAAAPGASAPGDS